MKNVKVYLAALFAIIFWGLSFIWSGRLVRQGIPVEYFLPIRIFLAGGLLLIYNLIKGYKMKIRRKDQMNFLILALLEPFIYFFCETYGIQFTESPTISSLVIATNPVVAMAAGFFFFKEKVTWQQVLGLAVCMVGITFVTRAHGADGRLFYFGLAVLVLAVMAEVGYASFTKILSSDYPPTVIVMHQFFIGTIFFIPLFLTRGMEHFDSAVYLGPGFWGPVLCLAVLCSTVAFTLWGVAIVGLGVAKSSIFQSLNPVVTALAGFLLGDELLTGTQWGGLVIAVIGVILTQVDLGVLFKHGRISGSAKQ